MMKSKVVGQPSAVSDDLVQSVDQTICERWGFTISELWYELPQISCTLLYEIITDRLGYQVCARSVPKMLKVAHKMQRMTSVLTYLEWYHKDGDEFLKHIVRVICGETWLSFVNDETKEQSKQLMHRHSPNKPKKFKQTLSVCQKADGSCFLGQERSANGGIHANWDHNNIRSVLWNTKRTVHDWPFRTKGVKCWYTHMRIHMQLLILEHCWSISKEVVFPPSLQPSLTPSDYHLLTYLKKWLGS
jgi:hypothetical protein